MDTSLLIEIAGLEATQKLIGERLNELRGKVEGKPEPLQKVVSPAKLEALRKARAAKKKAHK